MDQVPHVRERPGERPPLRCRWISGAIRQPLPSPRADNELELLTGWTD
jgi:hypothetical protein